jgi:uncharacterized protein (TIGR02246 family)
MRARIISLFLLASGVTVVADTAADEKEILRLEDAVETAWLKHDLVTIGAIFADDFQGWSFRGKRIDKAFVLRAAEKSDESDTKVEEPAVRIFDNTAIYTARLIDTGKHSNGEPFSATSCIAHVFVRRNGKWQIVSEHQTIVQK